MKNNTYALPILLGLIFLSGSILFYKEKESIGRYLGQRYHLFTIDKLLNASNPEVFYLIGNHYFGGGEYNIQKAKEHYREALQIDSAYPRAHYQLARIYFIEGNFNEALREINTEIHLFPDYKRSLYIRGLIYGYSGELDKARDDFREFLKWKPNSWAGHNDLVWVYFQKGDYEAAAKVARDGLVFSPDNPWLENSLGVALLNTERLEEARTLFERARLHAKNLEPSEWGEAYPGNDPEMYHTGLEAMRSSIEKNIELLDKKTLDKE